MPYPNLAIHRIRANAPLDGNYLIERQQLRIG